MTSLSEAYGGRGRSEVDPRRVYLGVGSFVAGTLLLVVGLFVAAEVVLPSGYSSGEARRLGGVLGGVGVPLVFLGVMTVLPADRNTRVAAIVGAAVMCRRRVVRVRVPQPVGRRAAPGTEGPHTADRGLTSSSAPRRRCGACSSASPTSRPGTIPAAPSRWK